MFLKNPLVAFIVALVVAYLIALPFLGIAFAWIPAVAVSAILYVVMGFVGIAPKLKGNMPMYTAIVALLVLLFTGAVSIPGLNLSAASMTPIANAYTGETSSVALADCWNSVSAELRGKSATVSLNGYDQASDTPFSSPTDSNVGVYKNGYYITNVTDTTNGAVTSLVVGDAVTFYGYNDSTVYVDSKGPVCIDREQQTVNLDVYTAVAATGLSWTCYDDNGAECSAGTNTTLHDWDSAYGAGETQAFSFKLKENTANRAYRLGGLAIFTTNDIESMVPTSAGLTAKATPKFLSNLVLTSGNTGGENATSNITNAKFDYYELDTPLMLTEWETVTYDFEIISGSTAPTTNANFDESDMAIVCALDSVWIRGTDNKLHLSPYTLDTAQLNLGVNEGLTHAPGATDCFAFEAI